MPAFIQTYVRVVDRVCIVVGKTAMWSIFLLIGLLLYATISRTVFNKPLIWGVELSQFVFGAYYFLGATYVLLIRGHVRIDVFYSRWRPRTQARFDIFGDLCLLFYLVVMVIGSYSSLMYAINFKQVKRSVWAPPLWPIKMIFSFAIALFILQIISTIFKDIAKARGENIEQHLAYLKIDEDV